MIKKVILGISTVKLTEEEKELFQEYQPYGIILFKRNCQDPSQLQLLTRSIKMLIPDCKIYIDQEGGRVARLRNPEFIEFPAANSFKNALASASTETQDDVSSYNSKVVTYNSLIDKIADALDQQAQATTTYSYALSRAAKYSFGYDWLGRRFYFDKGFEYKAFNYRISGGCAEILKFGIVEVGELLKKHASEETFMVVVIHDEIVLNMHKSDLHLLPEIKRIMIAAHRDKKTLGMDVGIEVGPNFHDLTEWKEGA